jgi:hypothetical protein
VSVVGQPAARPASISKALSAVFRKSRASETIPYVASFAVPANFVLPRDFEISRYQGLKLCLCIASRAGHERVVCHWQDESHFHAYAHSFQLDLGLSQPEISGFVTRVQTQKERFWQRYSWKEWVVGAAALFGAFSALHGYFANAFDRPDVDLAFVESSPIDVAASAHFSSQIMIVNNSAYTPTRIEVTKAFALPKAGGSPVSLHPSFVKLPLIPAGQSAPLQVDGLAPETAQKRGPLEAYNLEITVSARTGFFWGASAAKCLSPRELRVWFPEIGWSDLKPAAVPNTDQPSDFFRATMVIYPGHGYKGGASGYVIVSSAPDEDVTVQVIGEKEEELPPSPPGASVTHKVNFRTGALEQFQQYPLFVTLESRKKISRQRWNELLRQVEIYAE